MDVRHSEATAPERRSFVLLLATVNLVFLLVDRRAGGASSVVAARLAVTAALLAAWALLRAPLRPRAVDAVVVGLGAATAGAFALITCGTGASRSVYFPFLPMIPLVFTIAAPDAPVAAAVVGATVGLPALWCLLADGAPLETAGFWLLGFGTTTAYACTSAVLFVRQRAREARLAAERAAAEAALAARTRERARLDRLVLVGRLAAGVSHDLANPLSAARANLATAEERLAGHAAADPELREVLEDLGASLERMRRTVEDLRTFSRESGGAAEDCALADVVGEALRLLGARVSGADVALEIPAELKVRAERRRLAQAILWLLLDAAGALSERPPPAGARLRVAARRDGDQVRLSVEAAAPGAGAGADDGLRGLALALAREDLAKDGGALESEVDPACGVRSVIRLPAGGAAAPRELGR